MKKALIFRGILFFGICGCCFGQSSIPTIQTERQISEGIVKRVNERIHGLLEKNRIEEAAAFVAQDTSKCNALIEGKFCRAGLDFTQGYIYQYGTTEKGPKTETYRENAEIYYKKVLTAYPGNKAAWTNLLQLYMEMDDLGTAIGGLKKLADRFPGKRSAILVQMGDLYRNNDALDRACTLYQQAYKEDPFSLKAYGAMVSLYTDHGFSCTLKDGGTIRELAQICEEIDLSNRAEELLRKELITHMEQNKPLEAEQSMILWANVLANKGWNNAGHIVRLKNTLLKKVGSSETNKIVYTGLRELETIFKSKGETDFSSWTYWVKRSPSMVVSKKEGRVSPRTVLAKNLLVKGEKALLKDNFKMAEVFWQEGKNMAGRRNSGSFFKAALQLAQLYNNKPELDPEGSKFNNLIGELFQGKGLAYKQNDRPIIRRYHIVLGSIFYERKHWGPKRTDYNRAANARFQLEHAVSEKLGPIINPKLRQMLGDVYEELDQSNKAINAYESSLQDYLALDRISDADKLHRAVSKKYTMMNASLKNRHEIMGEIIGLRKITGKIDPLFGLSPQDISSFTAQISKIEKEATIPFSKEFVGMQMFKTLTDLGIKLQENRKADRQKLYSDALLKIKDIDKLASPNDFNRIKNIKTALEESVENPKDLQKTQMISDVDFNYPKTAWNGKSKTYHLANLNTKIVVPEQLFQLNKVISAYYTKDFKRETISNIQLRNQTFHQVIKQ